MKLAVNHLSTDKDISYSDLKALLTKSNKGLLVVDVRTKEEVDRGHIPGSIHIPGELQSESCSKITLSGSIGICSPESKPLEA